MEKNWKKVRRYKIIGGKEMNEFIIKESVTGTTHYYYKIEAESQEKALEIYLDTYPADDGSEFVPDTTMFPIVKVVKYVYG